MARSRHARLPAALLVACLSVGCLGAGEESAGGSRDGLPWRVADESLLTTPAAWNGTPLVEPSVVVSTDAAEYAPDGVVRVVVENRSERTLVVQGGDCGVLLARPDAEAWTIYGAAPGNAQEYLLTYGPGDACEADVPLGRVDAEGGVGTGLRRVVFHAAEEDPQGGAPLLVVAYAEVRLR